MNICFVSDYYTDFVGGGERSLANQMAALQTAGHHVFVIRPDQPSQPVLAHELAITPVFIFRISISALPICPPTKTSRQLVRQFLIDHQIDIVHSQGQGGPSYTALLEAHSLGIPFVDTVHTFFWRVQESVGTRLLRPISARLLSQFTGYRITPLPRSSGVSASERVLRGCTLTFAKKVDLIVSPSKHQRDALVAAGLETPVVCIPNPASLHHAPPIVPLPQAIPLRLVWIGQMNPEKRLLECIEALKLVEQARPGAVVTTIIGHGPEYKKAQAAAAGLTGVTFTGLLDQPAVLETLDQSHLLLLTSYHFDNQPMVITEAVSRHRGVVYCDELLTPELGDAGVLTPSPNPKSIASTILRLIDHPNDITKLTQHCVKQIKIFTPEHYVKQIEKAYTQLKKPRDLSK